MTPISAPSRRQLLRGGVNAFQEWDDQVGRVGEPWRFCWPTRYGHELFAWGLGLGDVHLTSYFDISAELVTDVLPPLKVTQMEMGEMSITADVRDYEADEKPPK